MLSGSSAVSPDGLATTRQAPRSYRRLSGEIVTANVVPHPSHWNCEDIPSSPPRVNPDTSSPHPHSNRSCMRTYHGFIRLTVTSRIDGRYHRKELVRCGWGTPSLSPNLGSRRSSKPLVISGSTSHGGPYSLQDWRLRSSRSADTSRPPCIPQQRPALGPDDARIGFRLAPCFCRGLPVRPVTK